MQFDTIILGLQTMHVQSTQNKMFAYLCNILRKKWVKKLIFCMQISLKVFYKLILWFLMRVVKHSGSSQNSKFAMPLQYVKKELSNESFSFSFSLHADKHQSFLQVDFNNLGIKVSYKAWSSILKILKVTSVQYLYNILKKMLGMEFIFCMQINIKVSTSGNYRFWWKWPDMSIVPNVLLLQCKTFKYFTGSSHVCCYLFFIILSIKKDWGRRKK